MLSSSASTFKPSSQGNKGSGSPYGGSAHQQYKGGVESNQNAANEGTSDSGRAVQSSSHSGSFQGGGAQPGNQQQQRYQGERSKQGRNMARRQGGGNGGNASSGAEFDQSPPSTMQGQQQQQQQQHVRTNSLGLSMTGDGSGSGSSVPVSRPVGRDRRDMTARQHENRGRNCSNFSTHPARGGRDSHNEISDSGGAVEGSERDSANYRPLSNYVEAEQTMRNDLALHFTRSGEWSANFIRGIELGKEAAEYPRLRRLMDAKRSLVDARAHPPLYAQFEPFSTAVLLPSPPLLDPLPSDPVTFSCAPLMAPIAPANPLMGLTALLPSNTFDVVLIHPPPSLSWSQIISLPIRLITTEPSFVFLHVGSSAGDGLERGREAFLRWGFRRCEELVWLKTNKARNKGSSSDGSGDDQRPDNLFVCQKEHYLMGIRGTVRRKTDNHFVHCNVDTDVMVWDPPSDLSPSDPTYPLCPPQLYDVIENFCLGTRRLELFGRPGTARRGWITIGSEALQEVAQEDKASVLPFDPVRYGAFLENSRDEKGRYVLPQQSEIESLRPKSPNKGGGHRFDPSDPEASAHGASERSDSFRPPPGAPARFGTHQAAAAAAGAGGGNNRRYSDRSYQSQNQRHTQASYRSQQSSIYGPQMPQMSPPHVSPGMGMGPESPHRGGPMASPGRAPHNPYRADYFQQRQQAQPMGPPYALQTPPYPTQHPGQPFFWNPYAQHNPYAYGAYAGPSPPTTQQPEPGMGPAQFVSNPDPRASMLQAVQVQMQQLRMQEQALVHADYGSSPPDPAWQTYGYTGDGMSMAYDGQPLGYAAPHPGAAPGPAYSPGHTGAYQDPIIGSPAALGYWMPSGIVEMPTTSYIEDDEQQQHGG